MLCNVFKGFFKKTTLWSIAGLALAFGVLVYATIDKTVVVTEQLIIIPGVVESNSWIGSEKILVGDLSEDSLYQDFTKNNSAYIDATILLPNSASTDPIIIDDVITSVPESTITAPDETTGEVSESDPEDLQVTPDSAESTSEAPDPIIEEALPEPDPVPEPGPNSTLGQMPNLSVLKLHLTQFFWFITFGV